MYNTDKTPTNEDLALRLVEIGELKDRWRDITKNFYGNEVATLLKEVAPADPYILYDLSAISLIDDGKTEQEALKIVDSYTHKEWLREFKGFKHTITKVADRLYKMSEQPNGQGLKSVRLITGINPKCPFYKNCKTIDKKPLK